MSSLAQSSFNIDWSGWTATRWPLLFLVLLANRGAFGLDTVSCGPRTWFKPWAGHIGCIAPGILVPLHPVLAAALFCDFGPDSHICGVPFFGGLIAGRLPPNLGGFGLLSLGVVVAGCLGSGCGVAVSFRFMFFRFDFGTMSGNNISPFISTSILEPIALLFSSSVAYLIVTICVRGGACFGFGGDPRVPVRRLNLRIFFAGTGVLTACGSGWDMEGNWLMGCSGSAGGCGTGEGCAAALGMVAKAAVLEGAISATGFLKMLKTGFGGSALAGIISSDGMLIGVAITGTGAGVGAGAGSGI